MFNAKETLRLAREAEKEGSLRHASHLFSKLARYFQHLGKLKAARSTFQHCVELTPKSPKLYAQLCRLNWELSEPHNAEGDLKTFVKLCFEKGNSAAYALYFSQVCSGLPALRQALYQELLSVERNHEEYFLELARAFSEQSNLDSAKKTLLDSLRAKHSPGPIIEMLKQIEESLDRQDNLVYIKRFEEKNLSLKDFLILISKPYQAETKEPENQNVIKVEEKSLQDLIRELEKEVGIDLLDPRDSVTPLISEFRRKANPILSRDIQTRLDMALAFWEMGLTAEAQDELSSIQPEHELFLQAQCLLANFLNEEGHDLKALEVLQKIIRDPRVTPDILLVARYLLALVYFRLLDLKKAYGLVQEIESENPEYRDIKSLKKQIEARLVQHKKS